MATSFERQNGDESELILPGRRESLIYLSSIIDNIEEVTRTTKHGIAKNWQPSDYLPDYSDFEKGTAEAREIWEQMRHMPREAMLVLAGDTLTEEGLPNFVGELANTNGLYSHDPLRKWVGGWSAEENRHKMVLNEYLRLSGRIIMDAYERSVQMFLEDGVELHNDNDPYKGFVYTSFQELATQRSHQNVAKIARKNGNPRLAEVCGQVAADEKYHARAYSRFVREFFKQDPNNMMEAANEKLREGIVMPAHNMREIDPNGNILRPGETYAMFSDTAQHIGVYTAKDYAEISGHLIQEWGIGEKKGGIWRPLPMDGLDERGRDAQEKILRFQRIVERKSDQEKQKPLPKWDSSWLVRSDKLAS